MTAHQSNQISQDNQAKILEFSEDEIYENFPIFNEILSYGCSELITQTKEVENLEHPELSLLIDTMLKTMKERKLLCLAANQIGVPLRVMVFGNEAFNELNKESFFLPEQKQTILVNPYYQPCNIKPQENIVNGFEACSSVPGMLGLVPRYNKIKYGGLLFEATSQKTETQKTLYQKTQEIQKEAMGFNARIIQNAIELLNGNLYISTMKNIKHFGYKKNFLESLYNV